MRKKPNPHGSPTPEKTSALSNPAHIGATHQAAESETTKRRVIPRGSESNPVDDLADILQAYLASGSKRDRERFYDKAWTLFENRARFQLRSYGWKGDVYQDAKEIASAVCRRMCQQEEIQKGIFNPDRASEYIRGYLNSAVYVSVIENRMKFTKKFSKRMDNTLSLDDEDAHLEVAETRDFDWQPKVARVSKALDAARVKTKNVLPPGVGIDSTELVMDLVLGKTKKGDPLKPLAAIPGVPGRTQQHRASRLRKNLRRELEI